ncbi:MAG: polysaccharide biosynthesis tyrosine autokinase [Chloroflexi bacterium]|nr:polysaccharide biosynthesis tyrosine autokinase [Chloroflexota bacterium]
MELRQYLALFRKWAWLFILTTAIAAGSSYFYSQTIKPTFKAETSVMVGRVMDNPNPSVADVYTSSNLAQTYALLVTQPPVLQAAAEALNWTEPWQTLYFRVTVTTVGNQLLKIAATDTDPQMAKAIADQVAQQMIEHSPIAAQQKQAEEQRAFVSGQLAQLKLQIETSQKSLTALNNQAALENDPAKLTDLNNRAAALQNKISDLQKNYASLSGLMYTGSNLFLTILAPAQLPASPVSPNIPQNVLFAALAGAVLAGGAILLLEYLDDTIKTGDDVQNVLKLPSLGAITRISGIRQPPDHLITLKHPRSPIAEAYRVFRTNLRFSGIENPSGALLVTSAGPGEGKTTTASNLAVILAQAGRRVILMDADLRRPNVHRFFGLSNNLGLSSLFLGDAPTLDGVIQQTTVPGLRVITSGPLPPNPAEVLDSKQMNEILTNLRAQSDLLILDSPPALAVADASILGSRCSGVVLVIDSGHTRTDVAQRTLETLQQTGAKVFGAVLNKLGTRRASGYYYHYYYYSSKDKSRHNGHQPAETAAPEKMNG